MSGWSQLPSQQPVEEGCSGNCSEECQESFEKIKETLTSTEVLAHYNPDVPLGLACDASGVGIGAVIYHKYEAGTERPIAYASKTLSDAERKYSQIEREAIPLGTWCTFNEHCTPLCWEIDRIIPLWLFPIAHRVVLLCNSRGTETLNHFLLYQTQCTNTRVAVSDTWWGSHCFWIRLSFKISMDTSMTCMWLAMWNVCVQYSCILYLYACGIHESWFNI